MEYFCVILFSIYLRTKGVLSTRVCRNLLRTFNKEFNGEVISSLVWCGFGRGFKASYKVLLELNPTVWSLSKGHNPGCHCRSEFFLIKTFIQFDELLLKSGFWFLFSNGHPDFSAINSSLTFIEANCWKAMLVFIGSRSLCVKVIGKKT